MNASRLSNEKNTSNIRKKRIVSSRVIAILPPAFLRSIILSARRSRITFSRNIMLYYMPVLKPAARRKIIRLITRF